MAKVIILKSLEDEINKRFKKQSIEVFELIQSLEENPKKGKLLGQIAGIIIKELKYKGYRFFFITDGYKIKCLQNKDLTELILKFVRMSNKKQQQQTINEIKNILKQIGFEGF